jgi:hypothetical protein
MLSGNGPARAREFFSPVRHNGQWVARFKFKAYASI